MPSSSSAARHRTRAADAGDLAERFLDRLRRAAGLDADLQHERARAPAELERGARAVGEPLVLAQVQVDPADELPAENRVGDDERVVVGRVARDGDLADAQLGLRRARPRHDVEPRRMRQRSGVGRLGVAGAGPVGERLGRQLHHRRVIAIADRDQRRHAGPDRPRVKRAHIVDVASPRATPRCRSASGRTGARRTPACRNARSATAPGMSRSCVSRCSRSWRTREKSDSRIAGRTTTSESSSRARRGEAAEDGDAGDGRVRADVGVELRAEPRERLVHLDRRTIAAAFVEHVGGDRGEAVLAGGIGRSAAADQQRERDQRHLRVVHGPDAQPVGQRRFLDRRKRERARRTRSRQLAAVDLHVLSEPGRSVTRRPPSWNRAPRATPGRAARC